jgi:cytochrome c oxidase subunit IV
MEKEHDHIVPYLSHGKILVILLFLTCLTIAVTMIHLTTFTVTIALTIASIKGFLVMYYFMHLRYEKKIFKVVGFGVIVLFALIVLITFLDYLNR